VLPPIVKKTVDLTILVLNFVAIAFGLSMLPTLVLFPHYAGSRNPDSSMDRLLFCVRIYSS
jgi:hypothetical protein